MLSRTKVAACLVSAGALIGPAIVPTSAHADLTQCAPITIGGQIAACLSVSVTPSQQPNGDPQLAVTATLQVYGQQPLTETETGVVPAAEVEGDVPNLCDVSGKRASRYGEWGDFGRVYGIGAIGETSGGPECYGLLGMTVVPSGSGQTATVTPPAVTTTPWAPVEQPYDVPQICITTTPGACVGPFDGEISPSIPQPDATPPGANAGDPTELCLNAGLGIPFMIGFKPIYPDVDVWGYYDGSKCLPYVPVGLPAPDLSGAL